MSYFHRPPAQWPVLRLSAYAYSLTPQKSLLANLLKKSLFCQREVKNRGALQGGSAGAQPARMDAGLAAYPAAKLWGGHGGRAWGDEVTGGDLSRGG